MYSHSCQKCRYFLWGILFVELFLEKHAIWALQYILRSSTFTEYVYLIYFPIVVWGFDEQTVKVLADMQKQQGIGPGESDNSNAESFTKYQVLISSSVYSEKPVVAEHQVPQPAIANQEVHAMKIQVPYFTS